MSDARTIFEPMIDNATASGFAKTKLYEISRFYSDLKVAYGNWEPHHTIIPGKFNLGMIPLKTHEAELFGLLQGRGDDKGLVVACNSFFELAPPDVIQPDVFASKNVKHHLLLMEDFQGKVGDDLAIYTLEKMMAAHRENVPVYIHCKAGRARSGMMATAHLCQLALENDADAIKLIKAQDARLGEMLETDKSAISMDQLFDAGYKALKVFRPNLDVGGSKRETGIALLDNLYKNGVRQTRQYDDNFLFLNAVIQSPAFKTLSSHLFNLSSMKKWSKPKRMENVEAFMKDMMENKSGWYAQMLDPKSNDPLYGFIYAEPAMDKLSSAFGSGALAKLQTGNRKLIADFRTAIDSAARDYPASDYAQQRMKDALLERKLV